MIKKLTLAGFAMLLFSAAGCNAISDLCLETEMGCRNHVLAHKAWGEWSWCYDELDHPHHFAKGFRAGYENILTGGKGCQPTLPPRLYWKPCFQTPLGQCQIQSWFDGYSHGALAAQQDGYGNLNTLPMSSSARQNLLNSKIPASNACFAEPGPAIEGGMDGIDGLIEMPGPLPEGEDIPAAPEGQSIEGQNIQGGNTPPTELAPPPYEQ